MSKTYIKHKIPSSYEAWKENRLKGIGGSDAGAILGLNPWKSAYMLWCEKTGRIKNDEDNEAMRLGRDLEDYVARRFTEVTGKKVRKSSFSYQSAAYPFMLANVDREIVGEDALLECKTTNMLTKTDYKHGDIPDTYYAQCLHYLAVTGKQRVYLAVLVMNQGFYWFVLERDEEAIQALIEAEKLFWEEYVMKDAEPPVDGSDSTSEALAELYPTGQGSIELFDMEDTIEQLLNRKSQIKILEKECKALEQTIKSDIGSYELAYSGGHQIRWKNQMQNRVDTERLRTNYPDIYDECLKQISFRKFEIKEVKA